MSEKLYPPNFGIVPDRFDPEDGTFLHADPKENARELAAYIRGWKHAVLRREDLRDGTAWHCFGRGKFAFPPDWNEEREEAERARDEQFIDSWNNAAAQIWDFVEFT